MKAHINENKIPGIDLRVQIAKAIFFLEKDVKGPLGLVPNASSGEKKVSLESKISLN